MPNAGRRTHKIATGIEGLDDILRGGLTPGRLYLIEGVPGSGKTTLAIQFLLDGVRRGETCLYVTLSETKNEITDVGHTHGWDLTNLHIHEMGVGLDTLSSDEQLTVFHASELELSETLRTVLDEVNRLKPNRVVFDSLSELRLLAGSALRYRRQIAGLRHFFADKAITVLMLDDLTAPGEDLQLQSIAHGVIRLQQLTTGYGAERRQVRVMKMRGVGFRGGLHDYVIRPGGLDVFPRLIAAEHHTPHDGDQLASGNAALDDLLGGGLPVGTTTLLVGAAGSGKSSVATQFCIAATRRGEKAAIYTFDETIATLKSRSAKIGMDLNLPLDSGLLTLQQVDPAELSPGEFAAIVRRAVEHDHVKVIVIDSLNGYLHSMPNETFLSAQLHELFTYLNQKAVVTLCTVAQSGMIGSQMKSPVDTTYLADNVVLFRYFEARGSLRRMISVAKKRTGAHELSIREFNVTGTGLSVGEPLTQFRGLLTGVPQFLGAEGDLLQAAGEQAEGRERRRE